MEACRVRGFSPGVCCLGSGHAARHAACEPPPVRAQPELRSSSRHAREPSHTWDDALAPAAASAPCSAWDRKLRRRRLRRRAALQGSARLPCLRWKAPRLPVGAAIGRRRDAAPCQRARRHAGAVEVQARGEQAVVSHGFERVDAVGSGANDRLRHLVDDRGVAHLGHRPARDAAPGVLLLAAARRNARARARPHRAVL